MKTSFSSPLIGGLRRLCWFWTLCLACLAPFAARAQWTTQTIVLQPGWNAVFLEVQPEPRETDAVFAGLPVDSVWAWNRRFQPLRFVQDPDQLLPGNPDWLVWQAAAGPATSLFAIHGGRCYLVKSTAAQNYDWQLRGRPVRPSRDWLKDSLNFVGFPVHPSTPPKFAAFFAESAAHAGQPIFRLQPNGTWQAVANPATTAMRSGEAFWINTTAATDFAGPAVVAAEQASGLDFGKAIPETILTLRNDSGAARTFTLTPLPSETPPAGFPTGLAGVVPLSYWKQDLAAKTYGWLPLDAAVSVPVAAGQQAKIRVAIRRADLKKYPGTAGISDYQYQTLLRVSDGAGTLVSVPVTARGGNPTGGARGASLAGTPPDPTTGLWVGNAVIRAVSQPANAADPDTTRPSGSEAQFRLIVHVDQSGQARLLQQVMLMWKDGTTDAQGNVTKPGQSILVTDDALLGNYTGSSLRDGKPVGRRISTVAFSHAKPVALAGKFGDLSLPLGGVVNVGYDDPLNPFKHRFHPDHDNVDEEYKKVLPEGVESYAVGRTLSLAFTATDPDGVASSRYGGDQLGGTYNERITGLYKVPVNIQGTFRLNRVSLVPVLDSTY